MRDIVTAQEMKDLDRNTDWRLQGCFIFRAFQSVFISREKKKR